MFWDDAERVDIGPRSVYAQAVRTEGKDLATRCAGGRLGHSAIDANFGSELLDEC